MEDGPAMIIVTHVPKTAGTSLRHYLQEVFGDRLFPEYVETLALRARWRRLLVRLGWVRAGFGRRVDCIIGHSPATKYDRLFPQALHAVWLRDPVERVVSNFFHSLRNPEWVPEDRRRGTLEEFIELEEEQNRQSR